jgi:hypothetical protein
LIYCCYQLAALVRRRDNGLYSLIANLDKTME